MIQEGDRVTIELEADENRSYEGTVRMVSSVAQEGNGETSYLVLIDFTPDEEVSFGMSVVVTTMEEAAEEAAPAEEGSVEDEQPAE